MTHSNATGSTPPEAVQYYRAPARALHWITALVVLSTIPAGLIMVQEGLPRSLQDSLFIYHKNIGPIIFVLVVARLVYRAFNPPPPPPAHLPPFQHKIAETVHWLLYALLLVMAISGYVRVRAGGFPIEFVDALGIPHMVPRDEGLAATAKSIHALVKFPLILLILAHIGAALMHAVVKRDGIMSRMLPILDR